MMRKEMNEESHVDKKTISRRRLMAYAWIGAAVLVIGELIGGTLAFLWPRRKQSTGENVFIAGKLTDLKVGEVVPFRKEKAFIVRAEGGVLAISAVCTHLHCIVNWNQVLRRFECPCHGAKFNPLGEVLEGPPPRPLDLYKIQIVAGNLVVNRAEVIERKSFDSSQLVKG